MAKSPFIEDYACLALANEKGKIVKLFTPSGHEIPVRAVTVHSWPGSVPMTGTAELICVRMVTQEDLDDLQAVRAARAEVAELGARPWSYVRAEMGV